MQGLRFSNTKWNIMEALKFPDSVLTPPVWCPAKAWLYPQCTQIIGSAHCHLVLTNQRTASGHVTRPPPIRGQCLDSSWPGPVRAAVMSLWWWILVSFKPVRPKNQFPLCQQSLCQQNQKNTICDSSHFQRKMSLIFKIEPSLGNCFTWVWAQYRVQRIMLKYFLGPWVIKI